MVGLVPGEYFSLLRVQPAMGRLFTPQEVEPGRQFVAAISRSLWRSALQLGSAASLARPYALTVRPTRLLPSCRISFPSGWSTLVARSASGRRIRVLNSGRKPRGAPDAASPLGTPETRRLL